MTPESDMQHFALIKRNQPRYTVKQAVKEYLSLHIGLMERLVQDYEDYYNPDPDDAPISLEEFEEYLNTKTPCEAFRIGTRLPGFNWTADWIHFDGYGNPEVWGKAEYYEWIAQFVEDNLVDAILDGDPAVPIPEEMADVLALWVDKDELAVDESAEVD